MEKGKQLEQIRHSLSHLMSMAILEKYPQTGLGVGPVIEDGFYQDYDLPESISENALFRSPLSCSLSRSIHNAFSLKSFGFTFENLIGKFIFNHFFSDFLTNLLFYSALENNSIFFKRFFSFGG